MVFMAIATISSIPLVVKDLNLKLLRVHVFQVRNLKLEWLVPTRVEVAVLGGGPFLLVLTGFAIFFFFLWLRDF